MDRLISVSLRSYLCSSLTKESPSFDLVHCVKCQEQQESQSHCKRIEKYDQTDMGNFVNSNELVTSHQSVPSSHCAMNLRFRLI